MKKYDIRFQIKCYDNLRKKDICSIITCFLANEILYLKKVYQCIIATATTTKTTKTPCLDFLFYN